MTVELYSLGYWDWRTGSRFQRVAKMKRDTASLSSHQHIIFCDIFKLQNNVDKQQEADIFDFSLA